MEELAPGVYEVEFSDTSSGQPYAMLALKAEQLVNDRRLKAPACEEGSNASND